MVSEGILASEILYRKEVRKMTKDAMKYLCKAFAVVSFVVGGVGSILCVPFAITNDLRLIATAGIYFIAGGVMIVGGLLSYVSLIKTE